MWSRGHVKPSRHLFPTFMDGRMENLEVRKILLMQKILQYVQCMRRAGAHPDNGVTVIEVCDGVIKLIYEGEQYEQNG